MSIPGPPPLLLLLTTALCISQTRSATSRRRSFTCTGTTKWGSWTGWSACQCSGETETRTRKRVCYIVVSVPGCTSTCSGSTTDSGSCSDACCDQGKDTWGDWGEYGLCACNTTDSKTYKTKSRACKPEHDWCTANCTGEGAESVGCTEDCCNIPFGDWNAAFKDVNCTCNYEQGTGIKSRNSTCPGNDTGCKKEVCDQTKTQTENCDDECCKNVDGGYADWESTCNCGSYNKSATNGVQGYTNISRTCTNPAPQCFGKACEGEALGSGGDQCCCRDSFNEFSEWSEWGVGYGCCSIVCPDDACKCRQKTCLGPELCAKCTDKNGHYMSVGDTDSDSNCTSSAGSPATLSVIFLIVSLIISDY